MSKRIITHVSSFGADDHITVIDTETQLYISFINYLFRTGMADLARLQREIHERFDILENLLPIPAGSRR